MTNGPWDDPKPEVTQLTLQMRRVHLPIHLFAQGTLVNATYLASMWFFFIPLLLAQPIWLTVLGFIFFGLSGLYAAFSLLVLTKTFVFGVNILDTRRSQ